MSLRYNRNSNFMKKYDLGPPSLPRDDFSLPVLSIFDTSEILRDPLSLVTRFATIGFPHLLLRAGSIGREFRNGVFLQVPIMSEETPQ